MYSDSESIISEFDDFTSDEDPEMDDFDRLLDEQVEHQEDSLYTLRLSYLRLFEDEDGPLRSAFPDLYVPSKEILLDLSNVLSCEGDCEEDGENVEYEGEDIDWEAAAKDHEAFDKHGEEGGDDGDAEENHDVRLQPENGCAETTLRTVGKPSPATKFMDKHRGNSLLVEVGLTVSRSELRERHVAQYPDIDFVVGYIQREPTGWALLMTEDPNTVEGIKSYYPSHRLATESDYVMFFRSTHPKKTGFVTIPNPPQRQQKKGRRQYIRQMQSSAALSAHIEAMGGMQNAIFVFLDVEAAVVQKNSVPLPLEIALVPSGGDHSFQPFHCFLHPGVIENSQVALGLSCGAIPSSHHVPLNNVTFLRRDYTKVAEEISQFLSCERVVLINKGSLMDVQALRWVFGAARIAESSNMPIPKLEDIACFDIQALKKLLAQGEWRETKGDAAEAHGEFCWYHAGMQEGLRREIVGYTESHCALKDAQVIHGVVQRYL
ncbi:uncharacterized protein TEOVI_000288600 [Trypanosoma equiperdum]|uniref:Uncharacterized protein n=1 Tax=Trypanosoma equiperdum TaxID=5694 RepID=A0A1G4IGK2_TRYEQ|nr:hypothetical protein, conserved [Trypanosoma equiperdum]